MLFYRVGYRLFFFGYSVNWLYNRFFNGYFSDYYYLFIFIYLFITTNVLLLLLIRVYLYKLIIYTVINRIEINQNSELQKLVMRYFFQWVGRVD